jgi:DNA repair protein RadC
MEQLEFFGRPSSRKRAAAARPACEWKIVAVRETQPDKMPECSTPEHAALYWKQHIATGVHFNPDVECFAVLLLNTKHRIRGHHVVSIGSLNETVTHPREVFRAAVIGAAYGVVLMADAQPSERRPDALTSRFEDNSALPRSRTADSNRSH